jgi:hypothetical protein
MEELKLNIHKTLQDYLGKFIPTQELTHAANEICKTIQEDGTYDEDMLLDMHTYLQKPDKEFVPLQTVNTKSITNNHVILAMNEIRNLIKDYKNSLITP